MSAIAGIFQFDENPSHVEHGRRLMNALTKYPADQVKTWNDETIILGCHAQWITPESIGEQLPYYDLESQLAITSDAIIDNRKELFDLLQVENGRRAQMPDSQLILLAYRKWGEESPKYLVGDFAFMIWDERKKLLFGARDFSGSRTLYYYRDQERFAFCTMIEPLFTLPRMKKELNEQWFAEFLAIPGMNDTVDTHITVYNTIQQVPPSHSISIEVGKVLLSRYCTLTMVNSLKLKTDQEYEEAFREVLNKAVADRLRTQHKVGAHLSGGLDSGSVVSFAAKALQKENKQLHTYSYVPPDDFVDFTPSYYRADEREYIESTVQHVGNIKELYLNFSGISPLLEIDDWLDTIEMPYKFFPNTIWIKGIFEKAQEQGVGILLNGGRGNLSVSWGSVLDYYALLLKNLKWFRLYHELNQYSKTVKGNRLRMLPTIAKIAFPKMNRLFSSDKSHDFPLLINPDLAKRTMVFEKLKQYGMEVTQDSSIDYHEARKRHFQELYPWNTTGTFGSKLSLRYSLWKRDPTNDMRVIRFCLSVPEEQFVRGGMGRSLIRRATQNLLPDKVRLNQSIRGIQGVDWLHRMIPTWNSFVKELQDFSKDRTIFELFNPHVIRPAIANVIQEPVPRPEFARAPDYMIAMRSLIVYRFIKNHF